MITRKKILLEIKKIYKYIEDYPDKSSILGPVTSAIIKLHMDLNFLHHEDRDEIASEIYKLKEYKKEKLKLAMQIEEKKYKILKANKK